MFGFFKKKKPVITLTSLEAGLAQFFSKQKLKAPGMCEAVVEITGGHQFLVGLRVLQVDGQGLYSGRIGPPEVAESVAECFARATNKLYYKVDDDPTHHFRTYVVRGKDIPNYKGVTTDLSITRAKLALDGPVPLGKKMQLSLELEDPEFPSLSLHCEVVSCSPVTGGGALVGVRWVALTARQEAKLEKYLHELKTRRP